MIILAIETSCDETALALLSMNTNSNGEVSYTVLDSIIHSQAEMHAEFGGVFPAMAKREHIANFPILLSQIIKNAQSDAHNQRNQSNHSKQGEYVVGSNTSKNLVEEIKDEQNVLRTFKDFAIKNPSIQDKEIYENLVNSTNSLAGRFKLNVDRIAVTSGPGLEPALWVGIMYAEALGKLWNVPVIPANHMEGHIFASLMPDLNKGKEVKLINHPLPALALLISGGHTEMVIISENTDASQPNKKYKYQVIGHTIDDALGEAYDKVARMMGLPYPGGPHIAKLAQKGRENLNAPESTKISLPRPLLQNHNPKDANYLNFSFSGLKTAVLYSLREHAPKQITKDATITSSKDTSNTKSNLPVIEESLAVSISHEFENSITDVLNEKVKRALEHISAQSLIIGGGVIANKHIRESMQKLANEHNIPLFLPHNSLTGDNAIMIACASYFTDLTDSTNLKDNSSSGLNKQERIIANGNKILGE